MAKKNRKPTTNLVSGDVLKEIQACRPLRLFINKQKKKGNQENPLVIRSKFLQLSTEKKVKYFQKAINKYIQLLDNKNISEKVQIEGQLLDNLLSKNELKLYFQSIDAPTKPLNTAYAYYTEEKKQENIPNPKPWKTLSVDEKKPYIETYNNAKIEYSNQIKYFTENLPERLKIEYLSYINPPQTSSHIHTDEDENTNLGSITQRRKSVSDNIKINLNDNQQKLSRSQLDDLHKCKPDILYFEKKYPNDDEKPTFANSIAKNTYIRSLFNELNEKKRHKFILKSTKKWEEFLELNPQIIEQQIPTLHLLLSKQDDIVYYFISLGLPTRPPISALILFNNEREENSSQKKNWLDLSQTIKDEYIKRLGKIKNEYHEKFIEFIEKILPSDYIRLEFFRNIKYGLKDYETFTKDRIHDIDEGQLKITQYLKPKIKDINNTNEFDKIKQQLLETNLNNEQKKLVEKLGQLMNKFKEEITLPKKSSSNLSKSSTNATTTNTGASKRKSIDSSDVILVNGEGLSDNIEYSEEIDNQKKKKKHKHHRNEDEEINSINKNKDKQNISSSTIKKRK